MNDQVIDLEPTSKHGGALDAAPPSGALQVMSPPQLLALAVQQGADLDRLERLMGLQERWEANEAKKAYASAFAAFKAHAVQIIKTKKITDGPLKGKKHAELATICNVVTPHLSEHGLSVSWRPTKDASDWIEVTCTLKHEGGHSESVAFGGPPDTGPGRNAIQARISTVSYLERITMLALLGLAAKDQDDDGAGGDSAAINDRLRALVAEGRKTKTDKAALDFWNANRAELRKSQSAYDEFKDQMSAHRRELKEAGHD